MSDPFLAAIAAHPDDVLRRLVYANHLDEEGDPRGQLVRVVEAMRTTPASTADYWQLKAERERLTPDADPAWLTAMGYDRDRQPLFAHGWPDDYQGRWRLVRAFAERWRGVRMPDIGGHGERIAEVERELERRLPASVREFVAFAIDWRPTAPLTNLLFLGMKLTLGPVQNKPAFSLADGLNKTDDFCHYAVLDPDLDGGGDEVPVGVWKLGRDEEFHLERDSPRFASVVEFSLGRLIRRLGWSGGQAWADFAAFRAAIIAADGVSTRFADYELLEGDGYLVLDEPHASGSDIYLLFADIVDYERLLAFLQRPQGDGSQIPPSPPPPPAVQ